MICCKFSSLFKRLWKDENGNYKGRKSSCWKKIKTLPEGEIAIWQLCSNVWFWESSFTFFANQISVTFGQNVRKHCIQYFGFYVICSVAVIFPSIVYFTGCSLWPLKLLARAYWFYWMIYDTGGSKWLVSLNLATQIILKLYQNVIWFVVCE